MRTVADTPTQPADYAALSAAYGAALGALALAARRDREWRPRSGAELAATGAATFALAQLVAHEKVETWLREPFVEERDGQRQPRGEGLRYAVGELLSCTRCVGAWSALGIVGLRTVAPEAGRVVTDVLAASALNDFLQAGFQLVCGAANRAGQ